MRTSSHTYPALVEDLKSWVPRISGIQMNVTTLVVRCQSRERSRLGERVRLCRSPSTAGRPHAEEVRLELDSFERWIW